MKAVLRFMQQKLSVVILFVFLCITSVNAQMTGDLHGKVTDEFGAVIVGATVTITGPDNIQKTSSTNQEGIYTFRGLSSGRYSLQVSSPGFAAYEATDVNITSVAARTLNITLTVLLEKQEQTISSEPPISTDPAANSDALVLRGRDLEALPDDPDELAAALQALAGPSAGPSGGQIYIDGFTGGRMPPKESIREVRINQNPFNAEFERMGYGRIEILTKPGTDKFRGSAFFNFGDESLNARHPLVSNRASYQTRFYGGSLSGPVISKKSSFFVDFNRREGDDNDIIKATILDPNLNFVPFNLSVPTPTTNTTFSPRFDYQLNQNNTLVARYTFSEFSNDITGIGEFSLLSRAYSSSNREHTIQLTETAILSPTIINETRVQYIHTNSTRDGDSSVPTINVQQAFIGGGSQVGLSYTDTDRIEIQNYTTWSKGKHALKMGGQYRGVKVEDVSRQNFGGTLIFSGIDANTSSLERYRRTILLRDEPLQRRINESAIPSQFTISGGNPKASVSQTDIGLFIQDDWRLRQNFTLSLGLRYEAQTNIHSVFNFAPRIAFAWSPGGAANSTPKSVVRGGFGIFYDRFNEGLILQARRNNGVNQQSFIVTEPSVLSQIRVLPNGSALNLPTIETLAAFSRPQTIDVVAGNIQSPYTTLVNLSYERQLPHNFSMFVRGLSFRTRHLVRQRRIGETNLYESSGNFKMNSVTIGINNRLSRSFSIFSNYTFGKSMSDTNAGGFWNPGISGGFPANSFDLNGEYSRSNFDARHRLFVGGFIGIPRLKIGLSPMIIASSGQPFNIITGLDTNGDKLFLERPALASERTRPENLKQTRFGNFDLRPALGEPTIPRNYGEGPATLMVNLGLHRTFGFGGSKNPNEAGPQDQDPTRGGRGPRGGGRSGGGGSGRFGGQSPRGMMESAVWNSGQESRYNLTFSVQVENILNRTNLAPPEGNLSSPYFGQSLRTTGGFRGGGNTSAGNRRVTLQLRLTF
jgi:hypothetical protein